MKIKFWGVRGSIPCPGPNTVKYGGNTVCIELRIKETDRLIIIDAGSGIRELGNYMLGHDLPKGPIKTEIYLTHTHWDHIMGFPFFTPIYIPKTKLKIYGPVSYEQDTLEKIVGGQLTYRYFPVREAELGAEIEYIRLKEGSFDLGDGITLITKYLNHPILCLGYRFEYRGKVFCTCYDTEPFQNLFSTDPEDPSYDEAMAEEGAMVAEEQNKIVENFFAGADLLIYDTQYTRKEYESSKVGWGHSSFEYAVAAANRAGVKSMAFFHHEPMRTDAQMDELAEFYCEPGKHGPTRIFFAREGMEIEL
ncbi:MAG: MBL fold metallo-hydrolase [Thermodesulfobacteriota bacterium]|nr:MBL fold metallo-hydrolase [Thermodesulfobacteriota bacterium]